MKFLEPLYLTHEELQSTYSYPRYLELEWEIQLNSKQLKKSINLRLSRVWNQYDSLKSSV